MNNRRSGARGKLFGNNRKHALIVLLLLLIPGVVLVFFGGSFQASQYWGMITPFITLILGYVFG